jgi:integrase
LTERRTLIPVATQSTVPNLTLSQDARLYKYVRLPSGWKYLRADYSEGLGVKPHAVFLPKTKTPTVVEGGKYVASDGGKWFPLSQDPNEAWTLFKLYRNEGRKSQLEAKSQQLRQQLATGQKPVVQEEKSKVLAVGDAIGNFLKSYRLKILSGGRKPRTYEAIEDILVAFKAATGEETPLAAATRESAITYIATLKKRTGEDTTKNAKENRFIYIQKMLRASGGNIFEEGDCPKAPSGSSEDIRVYSDDELKRVFDAASDYHRMCWKTLLMSGVREEELTYLYKRDVRMKDDGSWIIRVEGKPELTDWTPKMHEERNVNIPAYLGRELVEFSKRYMPNSPMLFPTMPRHGSEGGKVNGRLLDALNRDAKRAELNSEDFWLHGFRSTYATRAIRAGMDRGARLRSSHRRTAGPPHPSRAHPGDERRQLPPHAEPSKSLPAFINMHRPASSGMAEVQNCAMF